MAKNRQNSLKKMVLNKVAWYRLNCTIFMERWSNSSITFGLEMKYLGFTLSTTNNKAHTKTRISKTVSAFNKIRIGGLIQSDLAPETRAHLFSA